MTKILLFLGLFIISASGAYIIKTYSRVVVKEIKNPSTTPAPTPTPDPLRIRNILLLGYAGGNHDGTYLTDTIIVARIYPKENKIKLISIPRDLWIKIPVTKENTQYFKLNHAFAVGLDDKKYPDKNDSYRGIYGAGLLARESVAQVIGIMPENFIAIDFNGFQKIVDSLGGIEIYIPYSFEDKYYPIKGLEDDLCGKSEEEMDALHATMSGQLLEKEFTCRFETLKFQKGKAVMDGTTALKFVRSRHSDINGSDFGRALRQQAFLIAIKNELLDIGSVGKFIASINTLSKNVTTDIDLSTAFEIYKEQENLTDFDIETISLTTDNVLVEGFSTDRQYILTSKEGEGNWESVHTFIQENI